MRLTLIQVNSPHLTLVVKLYATVGVEFVFDQRQVKSDRPRFIILHTHYAGSWESLKRFARQRDGSGRLSYPTTADNPALEFITSMNIRHSEADGSVSAFAYAVEKHLSAKSGLAQPFTKEQKSNGSGAPGTTFRIIPEGLRWSWRESGTQACPRWPELIRVAMEGHPDLLDEADVVGFTRADASCTHGGQKIQDFVLVLLRTAHTSCTTPLHT